MKGPTITGMGCFARPATLKRVLQKIIDRYGPATLASIGIETAVKIIGQDDATRLNRPMAGPFPERSGQAGGNPPNRRITGFFLSQNGRQLRLTLFARGQCAQRVHYRLTLESDA